MSKKVVAMISCIGSAAAAYFFFPDAVVAHAGTAHEVRDALKLLSSALTALGGIGVLVDALRG